VHGLGLYLGVGVRARPREPRARDRGDCGDPATGCSSSESSCSRPASTRTC
jgi:hypothetical protein